MNKTAKYWVNLGVALVVLTALFLRLDEVSIRIWDEARLAQNALEMYDNHNYLVTYFEGKPDFWNTKPPLMQWLQVASLHLFGINEWAIRLPSAIAASLTCLLLFRFVYLVSKNRNWALLAVLVLVTCKGFVNHHVSRTGDFDALLVLFLSLGSFYFFRFWESRRAVFLYWAAIGFGFAVLTKSVVGFMLLPFMVLFLLYKGQLGSVLKNKHTYFAAFTFLIIGLFYYFVRESKDPGYLKLIMQNELGGRFLIAQEENSGPWYFYLERITGRNFILWFAFLPASFFFLRKEENLEIKALIQYCFFLSLGFLMVISTAQTKLVWYDAPIYPFFSIIVSYTILKIWNWIHSNVVKPFYKISLKVFIVLIFTASFTVIIRDVIFFKDTDYGVFLYMKQVLLKQTKIKKMVILYDGYSPMIYFYSRMAKERGLDFKKGEVGNLVNGDLVLVQQAQLIAELKASNRVEPVADTLGAQVFLITGVLK